VYPRTHLSVGSELLTGENSIVSLDEWQAELVGCTVVKVCAGESTSSRRLCLIKAERPGPSDKGDKAIKFTS
jgi:hypothetical protein